MEFLKGLNWVVVLGIVVAVETQIGNGSMSIKNSFAPAWIPVIQEWAGNLASIGALIMSAGAYGQRPQGQFTITPAVKSAVVAMLAISGLLMFGSYAHAQGGKTAPAAKSANGKVVTKAAAVANPITVLQTFTVSDLQAALADAQANNDIAASNCYSALLPIVQSGVANPFPTGLGGFQLLQKARDAKALAASLQSPNGPLATLNMACAPLVLDVQNTLIQLGVIGGGVAITAGTGGLTLPALPALIPGL